MWSIYRKVKAALDSEDIEGLWGMGAPSHEYNGEASLIESNIARVTNFGQHAMTKELVEAAVAEVWEDRFGPFRSEEFERRRTAFSSVAKEVVENRP